MNTPISRVVRIVSQPKVTLLMVICGAVLGAGSAGATPANDEIPSMPVKYSAKDLSSDEGARVVYRRIVKAADIVCPQWSESRFVSAAVAQCRRQAIERAVHQVNNARLVSLYTVSAKRS